MLFQHLEMLIQLLSTFTNVVYKLKTTYQHVGNICWGIEATFHINIWWKAKPHFWTSLGCPLLQGGGLLLEDVEEGGARRPGAAGVEAA